MKKILGIIAAILVLVPWQAYGDSTTVSVQATVLPVVWQSISYPDVLSVTQEDIERGYVDVEGAVSVTIRTNTPDGYTLGVFKTVDMFERVVITDGSESYVLYAGDREIHILPYRGSRYITRELSFRFYLKQDTEPGTYAWPVGLSIDII